MVPTPSHTSEARRFGAILVTLAAVASPLWSINTAHAQTVSGIIVPGSADPFLAGMPDGSTASSGDIAPDQSPILVTGLSLIRGNALTFGVTGSVDFAGGSPTDPPDGNFNFSVGSQNGLSGYTAPTNALVGVFLGASQPDLTDAPADLDFTTIGTSFTSLSPQLKQIFFIGDGLTGVGTGSLQQFVIPTGATRLFLGTVDGSGWFNNSGQFHVSITAGGAAAAPEPSTWGLFTLGALIFGSPLLRRKAK